MKVTSEMVHAAVKQGVESGLLPTHCGTDAYIKNYTSVEDMLKAALEANHER